MSVVAHIRQIAAVLLSLTAALPAAAQDISIRMDQIGAGSSVVFSAGTFSYTTVFHGREGDHYRTEVISGPDPEAGTMIDSYLRDTQGQAVQRVKPDGTVIRYEPHDCRRTLGECRYREIHETAEFEMVRTNTLTETGFSFTQTHLTSDGQERAMASGTMEFDAFGMLVSGTWTDHVRGGALDLKQVSADYR